MSPRTGRPKSETPKNIQLKIRADEKMLADVNLCAEALGITKSDVIRKGVQLLKETIEKK